MSATDKVKNKAQAAKGQIKKTSGEVTNNRRLEAEGAVEQAAGEVKQAGEKVKDAVESIKR
jgi:uncharacterized protein YjbJ (UPF0337 family)